MVKIPSRSLGNVTFDEKKSIIELGDQKLERQLFNVAHARKFMQTFLVAEACKELIDQGKTTSIRDLYYITKHSIGDTRQNTFEDQSESDPIIEDLEVTGYPVVRLHAASTHTDGAFIVYLEDDIEERVQESLENRLREDPSVESMYIWSPSMRICSSRNLMPKESLTFN